MKKKNLFFYCFSLLFVSTNAQHLGVGTTVPGAPLHVKSLTAIEILRLEANSPYISLYDNSKGYVGYLWYNTNKIELGTPSGSAEPVVIAPSRNIFAYFTPSGRLGLGASNPGEVLDVNGNINLSGTIKVNGDDGQPNQVLMNNSSGDLAWGDINFNEYKNFLSFTAAGLGQTWTVPAGVTRIMFEAWGGGGGGNAVGGGGGGAGYVCGVYIVSPGQIITIDVGHGGAGASTTDGTDGENSRVVIGVATWTARGGDGARITQPGFGGDYSHNSAIFSFKGRNGQAGSPPTETYEQFSATGFLKATRYGDGGDAGNAPGTGGKGGFRSINTATSAVVGTFSPSSGSPPGGGGSGYFNGFVGAKGLVIIYY